jgi:hypothetical protein
MKRIIKPLLIFLLILNINSLALGYYFFVAKPNQELRYKEIKGLCLNATNLAVDRSNSSFSPSVVFKEDRYKDCIK